MKNLITGVFLMVFTFTVNAQNATVKTVSLEQTKGEFTQKSITLNEGTYIFEISNAGVGHEVGFVLTPKGKTDASNHIKNAYVTEVVKTNTKGHSKKVTLKKGEYVYFCPLNPTPQYKLIVQ
ncbi:MAG: cupredoxin domain-containing protein [Flavobacteriaceae bacterium]|nr:cupredoxin domain-containing protein [Flavobacteriaceae bacterium]